ncbi:hypothetical protein HPB52_006361 [Rhipicephalus sanguineus]|uniref:MAM domain-containing protein n=1 Tax=Rhipicephalus sanguineus TaxID=34632 RepID=A0A9D4QDX3_RHISA|nr:hypothetical protein HPB52_006361 [Rhipicephalus sanguineus]
MAARPRGIVPSVVPTLLLLSLTLLSHLASTEINTNPPEPSNVVDGPLPDEYEVPEVSSIDGGDTASTTESDTNDEPNEIHAADGLDVHGEVLSLRPQNDAGRYMAVDSQLVPAGVSRLITPYLPGFPNSMVCLQMMYIVNGPGAERIQVVAQDMGNRPLFSLERRTDFVWKNFAINMTVHQDVRFFIEAYTNGRPGLIAIDDFTYSFDPCR